MHLKTALTQGLLASKMPDESSPHLRTLMAWPSLKSVSDNQDALRGSRQEVSDIANAIGQFEPVRLYAPESEVSDVLKVVGDNVTVVALDVDNLWMRDTGPTYIASSTGRLTGVNFNFNDWGNKLQPDPSVDWTTADHILKKDGTPEIKANLTIEGGALEIDGDGTLMATESSVINDNRNPGKSKAEIEQALNATLGVQKFIWFTGVKGKDITDDHIDGLARFIEPGVVLLSRPATGTEQIWIDAYDETKQVLQNTTDARGRTLTIHEIDEPANPNFSGVEEFGPPALNYVNYYLVNGGLIMPKFGDDDADAAAKKMLEGLFPNRRVVQVSLHWIPVTGGGIHCSTQQVPQLPCSTCNSTSSAPSGTASTSSTTPSSNGVKMDVRNAVLATFAVVLGTLLVI